MWAYSFLKMYLLSLKMGNDSFNNCLMSFCFSFNIHSTNIIEHFLCAMLEKQPQDLIKTELHKKTIFLPPDNSNLIGELLYFSAFWHQDKQLLSDASTDVLQKESQLFALCHPRVIPRPKLSICARLTELPTYGTRVRIFHCVSPSASACDHLAPGLCRHQ